jgi:hydrogenase maturation protein HypF
MIAFGAMLKNTVTIAVGDNAVVSQHIGDLDSALSLETAVDVARSLGEMYPGPFTAAVCDMHPDSPHLVLPGMPAETVRIQHHTAHVLSCMADNGLSGPVLGVAWDGTGFGPDGTVWGGEFLSVDPAWSVCRTAHLRQFPLPGGDRAALEPRRSAAGVIRALSGRDPFEAFPRLAAAFEPASREAVSGLLRTGVNCPLTSSAGRLFDAVSALLGLCLVNEYEGHAAMSLEYASTGETPFPLRPPVPGTAGPPSVLDWGPTMEDILAGIEDGIGTGPLAAGFHEALACGIREVALRAGIGTVVLTGGCFQNRYLTESVVARLRESGFDPRMHRAVPPGDGGISLGQALAARMGRSGDVPRGSG